MHVEQTIHELKTDNPDLNIRDRVDIVLDYLWKTFWLHPPDGKHQDKNSYYVLRTHPEYFISKLDSLVRIRSQMDYDDTPTIEELTQRIAALPPVGVPIDEFSEEDLDNLDRICYRGSNVDVRYSGEDILEIGFLIHSCTSFAILAYDLLSRSGIESKVLNMRNTKNDQSHSILIYKSDDDLWKKIDPKWQRHPSFFKGEPDKMERFTNEPYFLIHGVIREDGSRGIYDVVYVTRPTTTQKTI